MKWQFPLTVEGPAAHLENPYIHQVLKKQKEILTSAEHFASAAFLNMNPIESILVKVFHISA